MATGTIPATVEYPESDGQPMAETSTHRKVMIDLMDRLTTWFADDPSVLVEGNLFVYFEEGNPRRVLAPDCFVAFGVGNHDRDTFKTWEEGRFPDVVFEITSPTTSRDDLGNKFQTYQNEWRVKEYFLFDPLEEYLDPPLLGYRMSRRELRPTKPAGGRLRSKTLGITLERDGPRLLLRDAGTAKELPLAGEKALNRERRRRKAAEAEVARLKAELAALRKRKS
jgi:Uma2 family endonuclease